MNIERRIFVTEASNNSIVFKVESGGTLTLILHNNNKRLPKLPQEILDKFVNFEDFRLNQEFKIRLTPVEILAGRKLSKKDFVATEVNRKVPDRDSIVWGKENETDVRMGTGNCRPQTEDEKLETAKQAEKDWECRWLYHWETLSPDQLLIERLEMHTVDRYIFSECAEDEARIVRNTNTVYTAELSSRFAKPTDKYGNIPGSGPVIKMNISAEEYKFLRSHPLNCGLKFELVD